METLYNDTPIDLRRQVQALLFLRAFDDLCAKAAGRFRLVPLKGIDLLRFLYSDTLDRELNDIDVLVNPPDRALEFIGLLQDEGYRPEFPFALDKAALEGKKKVSMIAPPGRLPNVDVHLALITKKFFSATINNFNRDAISRIKDVNDVVSNLDDVDRWLYLAAHLSFHFLEGEKWYRDLALLIARLDGEELSILRERTELYNFERVVGAVWTRMQHKYPDIGRQIDTSQLLVKSGKRFVRYVGFMAARPERFGHGLRLGRYYWEFLLVSKRKDRCRAFLRMMIPSFGNMQNIYRCRASFAILLYVPHILINILGIFLFSVQYLFITTLHSRQPNAT